MLGMRKEEEKERERDIISRNVEKSKENQGHQGSPHMF